MSVHLKNDTCNVLDIVPYSVSAIEPTMVGVGEKTQMAGK